MASNLEPIWPQNPPKPLPKLSYGVFLRITVLDQTAVTALGPVDLRLSRLAPNGVLPLITNPAARHTIEPALFIVPINRRLVRIPMTGISTPYPYFVTDDVFA